MRRIIIELYDHTSDEEILDILDDLHRNGFDGVKVEIDGEVADFPLNAPEGW